MRVPRPTTPAALWYIGKQQYTRSRGDSSPNIEKPHAALRNRLWVMRAALGLPVVPDV
jgi:hypothetical protein